MTCGLFIGHLGLGDQVLLAPAIHYLATTRGYSKLFVVVKDIYMETIRHLLSAEQVSANTTIAEICYLPIKATANFSEEISAILSIIKTIDNSCQPINVHASGHYNNQLQDPNDFPINFYRQLGISWEAAITKFFVPCTTKSTKLACLLTYIPYIFIHDISSTCRIDSEISANASIDGTGTAGKVLNNVIKRCSGEYFLVNPEKNMYKQGHVFYELAEQFLREKNSLTLIDYKTVIENAAELHMITSCYFCFAAGLLGVRAKVKIAYSRSKDRFPTIAGDWTYVDIDGT